MLGSFPMIDMHVHLGVSKDGAALTPKRLNQILLKFSIRKAVVFPIDEKDPGPGYSRANQRIAEACRNNKRLIGFMRLDPSDQRTAYREFERGKSMGLRGVKLHPRSERFSPRDAAGLLRRIAAGPMPVVIHSSHELNCRPSDWLPLIRQHRKVPFILAHAGKDLFLEASEVARSNANVYLDTTTLSLRRTAVILKKAGIKKLVFGSDLPYSHPAIERMKFDLILGSNLRAKRTIFEENPKKIFGGLL